MYLLERIDAWSERHHPKWIDVFRILLGLILIWKGFYFTRHTQDLVALTNSITLDYYAGTIAHYVIGVHIVGGMLIAIGLLTRAAVLFQLPAMIGALVVSAYGSTLNIAAEPELVVLILLLLLFFLLEGSGRFSVDEYLRKHPDE